MPTQTIQILPPASNPATTTTTTLTITMAIPFKIMKASINSFFHNYNSLAATTALLVFPVSASILLSQSLTPTSSLLQTISSRLASLFHAAGLPVQSQFFSFLTLKLSQTTLTFFSTLPLSLSLSLLAKSSIIHTTLKLPRRPPSSLLLPTHLFNFFAILAANAAVFSLFILSFNILSFLHLSSTNTVLILSAAGAVLYSIVLTNAAVACGLAVVVSAVDRCGGYLPFIRACVMIKGRKAATAVTLALPVNLGLAATEGLFQYRVVRPYYRSRQLNLTVMSEAACIMCMYSVLVVLDVIISCMLFKSCRLAGSFEIGEEVRTDKADTHV